MLAELNSQRLPALNVTKDLLWNETESLAEVN